MRKFLEKLKNGKLAPIVEWIEKHPRLAAWLALSTVMVFLLILEAADVGLGAFQWVFLILATLLVAWLCVWIISWDEAD